MSAGWIHLAPNMRLAIRTIGVASSILVAFLPDAGHAQGQAATRLDEKRRREVVAELSLILRANYVFPATAEQLAAAVTYRLRRGEYDGIVDAKVFSDSLTSHLYAVAGDRHLWVSFDPVLPEASPDPAQPHDRELGNFGFRKLEILAGNVGYIDIQRFADPEGAGETAVAAMRFLAPTDAIIIDVRAGPGGNAEMVALLLSYFFGPAPVHLWDLYRRADNRTNQQWTSRYVPGDRLIAQPVFVLTSTKTFSASEAFAYTLKHLGRATIVGESTRGGANPGRNHRIDDAFTVFVPGARVINPLTGTNWQGTGVAPDVRISSELAYDMAYLLALDKLLEREHDAKHVATLTSVRREVNERLERARTGK